MSAEPNVKTLPRLVDVVADVVVVVLVIVIVAAAAAAGVVVVVAAAGVGSAVAIDLDRASRWDGRMLIAPLTSRVWDPKSYRPAHSSRPPPKRRVLRPTRTGTAGKSRRIVGRNGT